MECSNQLITFILILFTLSYLGVIGLILVNNRFDLIYIVLINLIRFIIISLFYRELKFTNYK